MRNLHQIHLPIISKGVLIVDGDNVRGKSKVSLSKDQLCEDLSNFVEYSKICDFLLIYFDHGFHQQSFITGDHTLVAFSGLTLKADDVIARDVPWIMKSVQQPITIITEDLQLRKRCRNNLRDKQPRLDQGY